jgi:hypothetical protein
MPLSKLKVNTHLSLLDEILNFGIQVLDVHHLVMEDFHNAHHPFLLSTSQSYLP